jgi:hypothetical protein
MVATNNKARLPLGQPGLLLSGWWATEGRDLSAATRSNRSTDPYVKALSWEQGAGSKKEF